MSSDNRARRSSNWRALVFGTTGRGIVFAALLAIVMYEVPYFLQNDYQLRISTLLVVYAIFTLGLDLTMGRVGQISLGHGGFFAVGAYAEALLQRVGVGPWPSLILAGLAGAVVGLIIGLPVLRVAGPYLAVVTIGFALTVQSLLYALVPVTGGANGLAGTKYLDSIGFGGNALGTYYGGLALLVVAVLVSVLLSRGRSGLATNAISDSPVLARASGVNVPNTKLRMFTISAAMAAVAGALFATMGYISPDSFSLQASLFPVAALVVGGMGTVAGPVLGGFLLVGFNQAAERSAQGSALLYGLLLCLAPLVLASGITGLVVRIWKKLGWDRLVGIRHEEAPTGPRRLDSLSGAALSVTGVSKRFRSVQAVTDVSLSIEPGEVVGLVGPNGSGKSTLLNMLSGYYSPTTGTIRLDGQDVTGRSLHQRVRLGVQPTFQTAQLMRSKNVRDNLALGFLARRARISGSELAEVLEVLDPSMDLAAAAGSLPEGRRKVIEIGRALLARPRLLLLDEPTSGLSQEEVDRVRRLLVQVASLGVTVVLADHNFEFVGAICDRVIVLEGGQILASGTADELRQREEVVEAYLGRGLTTGKPA
jgi:branched-chain amino acid transport system ATP-binding protein